MKCVFVVSVIIIIIIIIMMMIKCRVYNIASCRGRIRNAAVPSFQFMRVTRAARIGRNSDS